MMDIKRKPYLVWGIILLIAGVLLAFALYTFFLNCDEFYLFFLVPILSPWLIFVWVAFGNDYWWISALQLPIYGFIIIWATQRNERKLATRILLLLHIPAVTIAVIYTFMALMLN